MPALSLLRSWVPDVWRWTRFLCAALVLVLGGFGVAASASRVSVFAETATHLWAASSYSGSGALTDTGTDGDTSLTYSSPASFTSASPAHFNIPASTVDLSSSAQAGDISGDFTVLWVGSSVTLNQSRAFVFDSGAEGLVECYGFDGGSECDVRAGGAPESVYDDCAILNGGSSYLALVRAGDTISLYRNGCAAATFDLVGTVGFALGGYVTVGSGGGSWGASTVRGLAVWDSALSVEDVLTAAAELGYDVGDPPPPPSTTTTTNPLDAIVFPSFYPPYPEGSIGSDFNAAMVVISLLTMAGVWALVGRQWSAGKVGRS